MQPLTPPETSAHLAIIDTIALIKAGRMHRNYAPSVLRLPLEAFRARCPNCRRVLNWSARVEGMKLADCFCGARYKECA